jgi:hypothetical protein
MPVEFNWKMNEDALIEGIAVDFQVFGVRPMIQE